MLNSSQSDSSSKSLTRGKPARPSQILRSSQGGSAQGGSALTSRSLRPGTRADTPNVSQSNNGITHVETAIRLISETAHDLRSPLATVSATMDMLVDGDLGALSDAQAEFVQAARRQCEYLDTLVNEMLHADGLLNGMTTLRRRPVHPRAIQQMVIEATSGVLKTKRTELLFDGIADQSAQLYVDPAIVCRLLVNLVVNAERASDEGSHILIKVDEQTDSGLARWSVIDCGEGLSLRQLDQLAQPEQCDGVRSDRASQGTGLGLMICRQLAALNFSNLTIRSRLGSGTDVTFETPIAQASAIASTYARFRTSLTASSSDLDAEDAMQSVSPSTQSSWNERRLGYVGAGPQRVSRVAIGTLSVPGDCTNEEATQLDQLLQNRLGRFEMSYQSSRRSWVWVFDADHRNIDDRIAQISNAANSQFPELKLAWGEPSVAPVNQKSLQRFLMDRMIKQSLSSASGTPVGHSDHDSVRLGTQPIAVSPVAASRLDEELQRLSQRLKGHTQQLRDQSKRLRPPKS